MVSVKEHGVFISGIQIAGVIKAGSFFLLVHIVYYRSWHFITGKKNIHFFFFRSTKTAFGGKCSLKIHGNRKLVIGNGSGINAKDFCQLKVGKVGSLCGPVVVRMIVNAIILVGCESVTDIYKCNACIFKGFFCGIQVRILVGCRGKRRKLIGEDIYCIWCNQRILLQVSVSGCKIHHGINCAVKAFLGRCGKILHKIAFFAKEYSVSLCVAKNTLNRSTKCDPPVTEKELVVYIGFVIISEFAGCYL